jgi:predicted secreted protein
MHLKKSAAALALGLSLALPLSAFAFGHTTLLRQDYSDGKAAGQVPFVDGLKEANLQANLNHLIKEKANALGKEAGGKAVLSYEVTMNRPTLFSIILKAEGDRTVYAGMNLDVTGGKVLEDQDLLYTNSTEYAQYIQGKNYVFAEEGIRVASQPEGPLDTTIPYTKLLKAINVAEGARLLTSYKLDSNGEDMTLDLKPGELVALYMDANPTSGNQWVMVDQSAQPGFVNLGHSFTLPLLNPNGQAGSPGVTILFAGFSQPGDYQIKAVYAKKMTAPLRERVFRFRVR